MTERIGQRVADSLGTHNLLTTITGSATDWWSTVDDEATALVTASGDGVIDGSDFGQPARAVAKASPLPALTVNSAKR